MSVDLDEARQDLFSRLEIGSYCPCCNQYAKLYPRRVYTPLARELINLYRLTYETGEAFHHIATWRVEGHGGDTATMRYWDLIEEQPKDPNKDTRTSGQWRIRSNGIAFVQQKIPIAKYAYLYNQELHCLSVPACWWITDALGKNFKYSELMMWYGQQDLF